MTEYRAEPRISMNKLAEWMTASEVRRRAIVRDQIKVKAFMAARYTEGRKAMVRHLTNPSSSPRALLETAIRLRESVPNYAEVDDRRKWAMESAWAIESFATFESRFRYPKYISAPGQKGEMTLAGLRVLVSPDVLFIERGSERCRGAIKLHIGKTFPLNDDGLAYAASILYAYLKDVDYDPRPGVCIAVDVLSRKHAVAPRNVKTRIRNLGAACQTIVSMWPVYLAEMQSEAEAVGEDDDSLE